MILKEYISIHYMDLARFHGEKLGDIDRAIGYMTKARTMDPENAEVYLSLGISSCFRNKPGEAISFLENCYQLRPDDRRAAENLVVAYQTVFKLDHDRCLLYRADKLLVTMLARDRKCSSGDLSGQRDLLGTLRMLHKNCRLSGDKEMQGKYQLQILKFGGNEVDL